MAINVVTTDEVKEIHSVINDPLVRAFENKTPAELDNYVDGVNTIAEVRTVLRAVLKHLYLLHKAAR
jgi:hypothetical protein